MERCFSKILEKLAILNARNVLPNSFRALICTFAHCALGYYKMIMSVTVKTLIRDVTNNLIIMK